MKQRTSPKPRHGQNSGTPEGEGLPPITAVPSAVKRMLTYQIERAMAQQDISSARLAQLMHTSRASVMRLLDPQNPSVTLQTIERVSQVLGKKLHLILDDQEGVV